MLLSLLPQFKRLVVHNAQHELPLLWELGLISRDVRLFDTMIAAYFCNYLDLSLRGLTAEIYHNSISRYSHEMLDRIGMLTHWVDYKFPTQALSDHNATDLEATQMLYEYLKEKGLPRAFDLEMRFIPVLVEMEERGVLANEEGAMELSNKLEFEMDGLELPCNPHSPLQIKEYFGTPNAEAITLRRLGTKEALNVIKYKQCNIRRKYLARYKGRMHPDYNLCVVPSGRLSCSGEANLQQVPKTYDFRSLFIPKQDHSFIVVDYDQGEYVVAARLSGDRELNDRLDAGEDFHQYTVDKFGVPRTKAKNINFLALYLGGAKKLLDYAPEHDLKEAQEFLASYGLRTWSMQVARESKENGYADTPLGRRRLYDKGTEMINHVVQGGLIEIVKLGMIKTREFDPVLQVHDEIVYEVPTKDADEIWIEIQKRLEANPFRIKVSGGVYRNWGESILKPEELAERRANDNNNSK